MPRAEPEPVRLPLDDDGSVYANAFGVWVSPHDIALDLHLVGPLEEDEGERVATPVVRVRLPATMVFSMIQRLSAALGEFYGEDWT